MRFFSLIFVFFNILAAMGQCDTLVLLNSKLPIKKCNRYYKSNVIGSLILPSEYEYDINDNQLKIPYTIFYEYSTTIDFCATYTGMGGGNSDSAKKSFSIDYNGEMDTIKFSQEMVNFDYLNSPYILSEKRKYFIYSVEFYQIKSDTLSKFIINSVDDPIFFNS